MHGLGACSHRSSVTWLHRLGILQVFLCCFAQLACFPPPRPPIFSHCLSVRRVPGRLAWGSWLGCGDCQPLGPGAGWPASSGSPWTSQAPNLINFRNVVVNVKRTMTLCSPFRAFGFWVVFEIKWKIFIKLLRRWSQALALLHTR